MSAQLRPSLERYAPMTELDLDDVVEVEKEIYPFPWTRGNFADSLHAGYSCWALRDAGGRLQAYAIVMLALDEAHLLNLSVARDAQRAGWAGGRCSGWPMSPASTVRARCCSRCAEQPGSAAPVRAIRIPAHRRAPRLLPGTRRARGCHRDADLAVTLDPRRARLWNAMGLGPVWDAARVAGGCRGGDGRRRGRRSRRNRAAESRRRDCTHGVGRAGTRGRRLHGLSAERDAHTDRVRRWQSQRRVDAGRRGAGCGGGCARRAIRGPGGAACSTTCSRQSVSRARVRTRGLSTSPRAEVPATRQPQPRARTRSHSATRSSSARSNSSTPGSCLSWAASPPSRSSARGQHCKPARHGPSIEVAGRRVPVVVTYHPAYLLRNLADKASRGQTFVLRATWWPAAASVALRRSAPRNRTGAGCSDGAA